MADKLKKELGIEAVLQEGGKGEFSVWVDGKQVLAKKQLLYFPRDSTVLKVVRKELGLE